METKVETVYFEEKGPKNTERTLEIAKERAEARGIKSIVVASTKGDTGVKASRLFKGSKGYNLIVVTHSTGFTAPNVQELTEENRQVILESGSKILTSLHSFGGVGRAVRKKLGTYQMEELIAYTLRIFGEGMKTACEITLMAADAGLIRTDEEVIAIAGTGRGADTAILVRPANSTTFFNLRVKEILCKPHF